MARLTTVTIARKKGSGGSYVGRAIAQRLGLPFVDQEVVTRAADALGVAENEVEANCERVSGFWERLLSPLTMLAPDSTYTPPPVRSYSDTELFQAQVDALRCIAKDRDCVIMGYGGAFVLPHHDRMVNLYFHAPVESRVRRVMQMYRIENEDEARRAVAESDAHRKKWFLHMTGRDWACADNYDLAVDTSLFPLDELADKIVHFVERKVASGRTGPL